MCGCIPCVFPISLLHHVVPAVIISLLTKEKTPSLITEGLRNRNLDEPFFFQWGGVLQVATQLAEDQAKHLAVMLPPYEGTNTHTSCFSAAPDAACQPAGRQIMCLLSCDVRSPS